MRSRRCVRLDWSSRSFASRSPDNLRARPRLPTTSCIASSMTCLRSSWRRRRRLAAQSSSRATKPASSAPRRSRASTYCLDSCARTRAWRTAFIAEIRPPRRSERKSNKGKPPGPKTSTSIDLPLSKEYKRALAFAADEAHRRKHQQIGNEHLLLGLLREEKCLAAELLRSRGIDLEGAEPERIWREGEAHEKQEALA